MHTKQLSACALGLSFLVICAKITIPIGPVPLTLQTMAVVLLGLVLDRKSLIMIFTSYMIAGLSGLPVFASGGGLGYILQPSFGFLLSFLPASLLLAKLKERIPYLLAMLFAFILIDTAGILYMKFIFSAVLGIQKDLLELITIGVLPFLANDLLTGCLAIMTAKRLNTYFLCIS